MTEIPDKTVCDGCDGLEAFPLTYVRAHTREEEPINPSHPSQPSKTSIFIPARNEADPSETLLSLDLGTTTGWAVRTPEGLIQSGTVSFRSGRFEGGGMRFLRFRRWLDEMQDSLGGIDEIAFEEVRAHRGTDAAHVYGGLLAILTAWCEAAAVPYRGVPVAAIKRHATGKGNARKEHVIAAVKARGFDPADDNEADALALLLMTTEGDAR